MTKEIYEEKYNKKNSFSFGKNWQNFLKNLNEEKIKEAEKSLVDFLGGTDKIKRKTFVDIGCGSGLFSLAAYNLGAEKIVSVDVDKFSIACVTHLHNKENSPNNWDIKKGSALNNKFINSLGKFDVVYSWGVLHHTGGMYKAFDNVVNLMGKQSIFYLAIYNENIKYKLEGTSKLWVRLKRLYGSIGVFGKKIMEFIYISYFMIGLCLHFKNPIKYIQQYKTLRGMNFYTDIKDWLGGYPYEFANIKKIENYFKESNLKLQKYNEVRSLGCNEFLFRK